MKTSYSLHSRIGGSNVSMLRTLSVSLTLSICRCLFRNHKTTPNLHSLRSDQKPPRPVHVDPAKERRAVHESHCIQSVDKPPALCSVSPRIQILSSFGLETERFANWPSIDCFGRAPPRTLGNCDSYFWTLRVATFSLFVGDQFRKNEPFHSGNGQSVC